MQDWPGGGQILTRTDTLQQQQHHHHHHQADGRGLLPTDPNNTVYRLRPPCRETGPRLPDLITLSLTLTQPPSTALMSSIFES